jgi:hypothetical protein
MVLIVKPLSVHSKSQKMVASQNRDTQLVLMPKKDKNGWNKKERDLMLTH